MDTFTRSDLRTLIEQPRRPSVSLYFPTDRTGVETRQAPIRCKNLLHDAEQQLVDLGLRRPDARAILEPAQELQGDGYFWTHQSQGLAMFAAPGYFRRYRLPVHFDEHLVVSDRFCVKPVLPLLDGDGRYYLLAVSQDQVRLFQGTKQTISEITPENLPHSLTEALNIDEFKEMLDFRSYRGREGALGSDAEGAIFAGQGSGMEVKKKDELLQFFRRLDDGLEDFFHLERAPLVFAGVGYLLPIFRMACTYRNLVAEPVEGNPERIRPEELHRKAWKLVEPRFKEDLRIALEQYGTYAARNLASTDLEEILTAAEEGRVDTLFLAEGKECWAQLDDTTGAIHRTARREPGAEDLLDLAAVRVLLQGGMVYSLEPKELPAGDLAAAMFRYENRATTEAATSGERSRTGR